MNENPHDPSIDINPFKAGADADDSVNTPLSSGSMTASDAVSEIAEETAVLLEACSRWVQRYIVVSDEQSSIIAVWILHTYVFEAADVTPYIHITAPERECGKSNLMRVLAAVANSPVVSDGMTAAALVRCIDAKKPTIFLDEMDAALGGSKEFAEVVRGILNAGYSRGGKFYKCHGDKHELREFNAYCPKCFAGIGHLPETVASRSIVIELKRKTEQEAVEPLRERAIREASTPIRARLERWKASGVFRLLEKIRPMVIPGLGDRQNDIAEPLLCIGTLAGPDWLQRLSDALITVLKGARSENVSLGVALLADIRAVFDELKTDRISSEMLAERLCAIEGRRWADWSHEKGLSANNLARQLAKYRIQPLKIRFALKTLQGYMRDWFEESWTRYCPIPPGSTGTPEQPASLRADTSFSNRNTNGTRVEQAQEKKVPVPVCSGSVPVSNSSSNPHEQKSVPAVPVQRGVRSQPLRSGAGGGTGYLEFEL